MSSNSAPDGVDLSGRTVGEYELLRRIGSGGMGVVYEGIQPVIGKRVAVKVLQPQLVGDEETVARFLAEARAVNAIRHRGIIDIFSFGRLDNGVHYFVMEFLDGEPFDAIIADRAPLPYAHVIEWAVEVLDALDAAHAERVIHRDIKPSNLFLVNTRRGRPYVKLLDFGIAKLQEGGGVPMTRATLVLGTPEYMAPEQARGQTLTHATDLYSVGCVLFEMLTGHVVFEGKTAEETLLMQVEQPPRRVSSLVSGIPSDVDDLIAWTLRKNPTQRPKSALELRQYTEALTRKYPVERTVASLPPRGTEGPVPSLKGERRGASPIDVVPTVVHGPATRRETPRREAPPRNSFNAAPTVLFSPDLLHDNENADGPTVLVSPSVVPRQNDALGAGGPQAPTQVAVYGDPSKAIGAVASVTPTKVGPSLREPTTLPPSVPPVLRNLFLEQANSIRRTEPENLPDARLRPRPSGLGPWVIVFIAALVVAAGLLVAFGVANFRRSHATPRSAPASSGRSVPAPER